jgi:hypothetical protein
LQAVPTTEVSSQAPELYDPESGSWKATGSLNVTRSQHTATLLPNGKVLVAGGFAELASAELYDPAIGTWSTTDDLATGRDRHTATLLHDGQVLVAGGANNNNALLSAELYDVGLSFRSAWQPEIATAPSILTLGQRLELTGSRFQGISQASGGSFQESASNYPIVQLRSLENSQVAFLLAAPVRAWSRTTFISRPVTDFPSGPALVTVFTNGIPSTAKYLVVSDTP